MAGSLLTLCCLVNQSEYLKGDESFWSYIQPPRVLVTGVLRSSLNAWAIAPASRPVTSVMKSQTALTAPMSTAAVSLTPAAVYTPCSYFSLLCTFFNFCFFYMPWLICFEPWLISHTLMETQSFFVNRLLNLKEILLPLTSLFMSLHGF